MDKETRNVIERATQKARRLLEEEFEKQLVGDFDILLDGKVAPRGGDHLSPRQHAVRERIVASIAHRRAAGEKPAEAVASYVRDAAFTTLNRFVALRMLEARGLLKECVSRGEQSSGYGEFHGLAPGLKGLPDGAGYRLYLESLFDELSTEVKVLFDRRDPASALWPRKGAFDDLLAVLNAPELSAVWAEDETIGWVYQYFNSGEERRAMRDASQAPRNSRELAVRNQFFTPRYVVRFLTENTLARIWIEMMGGPDGASRIADRCDFLVRDAESRGPRAKKDPRDLKLLDPACGSGHFLLYAFDLLLVIYEEAWADPEAARFTATGRSLKQDYPDLESLRKAAPLLVLEHNLHGVDIDPRCAQIAALALWLRAQRAWKEAGVPAGARPRITRTHIVVAEPMPGDAALVEEFAATLNPPLLGGLFRKMVAEMRLAGELGTLLKIETLLGDEIRKANAEFNQQKKTTGYLPGFEPPPTQGQLDFSQIDDAAFFDRAEALLLAALRRFAESVGGGVGVRRRLFAGDAAQGIALVDIVRAKYDVVLMNPPFGDPATNCREVLAATYPGVGNDILVAFLTRGAQLCDASGDVGALTSRMCFFLSSYTDWRRTDLLTGRSVRAFADLGYGVLDGAMVEVAASIVSWGRVESHRGLYLRLLDDRQKEDALLRAAKASFSEVQVGSVFWMPEEALLGMPSAALTYWVPEAFLVRLRTMKTASDEGVSAYVGLSTADDERFLRLWWEVPGPSLGLRRDEKWVPLVKGGEYSPFYDDVHLCVAWGKDGKEMEATGAAIRNRQYYFRAGVTYSQRSTSAFNPKVLPEGCIFSTGGHGVIPSGAGSAEALYTLAVLSSRYVAAQVEMAVGSGDQANSGSAARNYLNGMVSSLKWPSFCKDDQARLVQLVSVLVESAGERVSSDETARVFCGPRLTRGAVAGAPSMVYDIVALRELARCESDLAAYAELDSTVTRASGLGADDLILDRLIGPLLLEKRSEGPPDDWQSLPKLAAMGNEELIDLAIDRLGAARILTKKAYVSDRRFELIARLLGSSPGELAALAGEKRIPLVTPSLESLCEELLLVAMGVAFGRWPPAVLLGSSRERRMSAEELLARPPVPMLRAQATEPCLVADLGHTRDLPSRLRETMAWVSGEMGSALWQEGSAEIIGGQKFRDWVATRAFDVHLSMYSKSRRKAPIYWQLATASASYSVWLYCHRLTPDSFFHVLHEFVSPKLALEERKLLSLTQEVGPNPTSSQRKEIAVQETFVDELRAFREEVARVAPLWKPDLDDGVLLTMAPLWRLVPQHRAWQKELKTAWDSLCEGEYDWAHVAMHLWPERVVPKCAKDRSLAIAHDLEQVFWEEDARGKWVARPEPLRPVEELVGERTSPAVRAALKDLLEAPVAGGPAKGAGRGRKRKA